MLCTGNRFFPVTLPNVSVLAQRAAFGGYKECVLLLIQRGANLAHTTIDGETVADMIFGNIAKPNEFINEILNAQIQVTDSEKCNENFCVTAGMF